jgi:CRISPR-associated protein Csd1
MSILASLVKAYERLPDAPPFGFSTEKIGYCISLNRDGSVAGEPIDLREGEGKKKSPRILQAPQGVKRTVDIAPNFLWDKTAYVLGVTAGEGKRTADEHAAYVAKHLKALDGTDDAGLAAFLAFLRDWTPERFAELGWPDEMKDQNIVFAFEPERLTGKFLHDRPAAKAIWRRLGAEGDKTLARCLVSGETGPVARLHPSIKGVWGAQTAGASIVSFNLDAFTSYGHEQGDNAPVSEAAVFAYTTALNRYLERDSGHRLQIGDASVVFWADATDGNAALAEEAEEMFLSFIDEKAEAGKVGEKLKAIRNGAPLTTIEPRLQDGVRFHVLALAPNAARLSIRFYLEDTFGRITENYQRYLRDMAIEPPPRDGTPPLWRYLVETAVLNKRKNIQPNLAGDWFRAILAGTAYPLTLLSAVLMRIRSDKDVNALRTSILKALLTRNFATEVPVALDPNNQNRGYLLGRLFAAYEETQRAALGGKVNATIKDKFYGSASAQPRKVFPVLDKGSANHLSKVGKQSPGRRVNLERLISEIMEKFAPDANPFPTSLNAEDQALFAVGYYHQRSEFFRRKDETQQQEAAQ